MRTNRLTDLLISSLEAAAPAEPTEVVVNVDPTLIKEPEAPGAIDNIDTGLVQDLNTNEVNTPEPGADDPIESPSTPVASVEEFDNTDSLGGGSTIDPNAIQIGATQAPLTREELEEHLEEDKVIHEQLHQEIEQVKGMVQADHQALNILSAVAPMENASDNDLAFANIALESIAKQWQIPGHILKSEDGKVSMEGLRNWIFLLRNSGRQMANEFNKAIDKTGLGDPKYIDNMRRRVIAVRGKLKDQELRQHTVRLPKIMLQALQVHGGPTDDLAGDLQKFFNFALGAANQTATAYAEMAKDIYGAMGEINANTNDASAEAIFKTAAGAVNMDFYQTLEPGTNVYLGNVQFKKPLYAPRVSLPKWCAPIQEVMSRGGYEAVESKTLVQGECASLTREQCLAVLEVLEKGLEQTLATDKVWRECMAEIKETWNSALERNALLEYPNGMGLNDELNAVAWYTISSAQYLPGAAWSGIVPVYTYLAQAELAALSLVELSILEG